MIIRESRSALVVDDDPRVWQILQEFLKLNGYEVVTAANGEEALGRVMAQEFDLVLLDIQMPGISGIEVLERLHATYPDTAVIMITGLSDTNVAVHAMKQGAYDYVVKPFNLDDLGIRLEKAREKRVLSLQVKAYQKTLEERVAQQAKELREMMTQTVQALIKEEVAVHELKAGGGRRRGASQDIDLKKFGTKILSHFGSK